MSYLFKVLASYILMLVGFFVIPVAMWRSDGKHLRFGDSIWGNRVDGFGDKPYYENQGKCLPRWLAAYIWLAIRNPVNNWLRRMGPDGLVQKLWVEGATKYAVVDGQRYWFTDQKLIGRIHFWTGYKLLNIEEGKPYDNLLLIWPLKYIPG